MKYSEAPIEIKLLMVVQEFYWYDAREYLVLQINSLTLPKYQIFNRKGRNLKYWVNIDTENIFHISTVLNEIL